MAAKRSRRTATAYHEAGHAVAAYLVRYGFRVVSIERNAESLEQVAFKRWQGEFHPDAENDIVEGSIMNGRCLHVGKEFLALIDYEGSGLVVKLPKARVGELVEAGVGRPFGPAGRVFKEWLSVPKPDRRRLLRLLREGVAFATRT
jgi:hypothetical protein